MTALCAYRRRWLVHELVPMLVLLAAMAATPACAADVIKVRIDQASITKMPERVSTVVIGNPLIADVTVQPGGLLVVTGKGYGTTNLIALDRAGAVLVEHQIEVISPQEHVVVVYRGLNRESYSCEPQCEPRITLGDSAQFFDPTLAQSGTRTSRAQASSGAQH
jgi:hypothetical protein